MMKFINKGQTLLIDLGNTYLVQATAKWNFQKEKYDVELYLRREDVTVFDEVDSIELESSKKDLFKTLLHTVERKYKEGYFDKSIERYEYLNKCVCIGIDTVEGWIE